MPNGKLSAYQTASVWEDFAPIVESDYITGIGTVGNGAQAVFARDGEIVIEGIEGSASIYDMGGQLIYAGEARSIMAPHTGMYIVKAGGKAYKVIVK